MSAGLERICQVMADYLKQQGVEAVTAWPMTGRKGQGPVAAVTLRGCQVGPGGFQDYLGERYDDQAGVWEERYGRRAKLIFGLDLYAGEKGDGRQLQQAFDGLAGALLLGGPEGLQVEEFSGGETEYDPDSRRLRQRAQAVCTAYLSRVVKTDGEFVDFELRGVAKV